MSQRVHAFNAAVKKLIVPALASLRFVTNPRRRVFRRVGEDHGYHFVQIVSFQIGSERRSGHFTVNLGVFCAEVSGYEPGAAPSNIDVCDCMPEMWRRLGLLFHPRKPLFRRILPSARSRPIDYWWKLEEDQRLMEQQLIEVRDCLLSEGIPWLERTATRERVLWAKAELDARRKALAARGADQE